VALARRQARLEAVRAYLSVQMSLETVRLLADSLKLAQSQYRDIALRLKAGSASRLDSLQAHQDVLSRQKDFASARTALGGALQDLFALTRTGAWLDTAFPLDSATASAPPEDAAAATLVAATDPLEVSSTVLDAALSTARPDEAYPGVGFYARMADASRSAANGVLASNLPQLSLTARASRDYPNGPVLEQVNQRMLGAAVSFPLFEGGKRARDEWEQRERAKSFDEQAGQAAVELARDWNKARDALAGLKVQGGLDRQASAETRELAGLTYDAYKTGQARFTDVQAANLRSLHAVVAEARTKVETLMQLAAIKVLSRGE
jgi:outer membrane protein TolC